MLTTANEHFRAALVHYRLNENDQTLQRLRDAVGLDADHGRAWELMGIVERIGEHWANVVTALEVAQTLIPLQPLAQCALADGYLRTNKPSLAMVGYRWLLSLEDVPAMILLQCGRGLAECGDPTLALQATRLATRRDPDCARGYLEAASYAAQLGRAPELVEALLRRAHELEPDTVDYRVALAGFLAESRRDSEACVISLKLTEVDLDHICCGCCLRRLRDHFERVGDPIRAAWCAERIIDTDDECGDPAES